MIIAVIWPSKDYYYDYPYHGESRYIAKIILCLRGVLGHTVDVIGTGENTITVEEALTKNYDVIIEHDVRTELGRMKANDSVLWHGNWTMPFKKIDQPDTIEWIYDKKSAQERLYDRHLAWHSLSIQKSNRYKLSKKCVIWYPPMIPVNKCDDKFRFLYSPPFPYIHYCEIMDLATEIYKRTGYYMDVCRLDWYIKGLSQEEVDIGQGDQDKVNIKKGREVIDRNLPYLRVHPSLSHTKFTEWMDESKVVITMKYPDPFVSYLTMEAIVQGAAVVCEKGQEEYMKPDWGHQINPWRGPGATKTRTREICEGVVELLNNEDYWYKKTYEATEQLRKETDLDGQAAKLEEWLKEDVYG